MNAVYDAADNEMIVFGGGASGGVRNNATTTLSNANGLGGTPAWTVLSPTGPLPPARNEHGVVYDAADDVLITYGGFSGNGDFQPLLNDVWALSNASGAHGTTPAWTQLLPTGGPPTIRADMSSVYDSVSNRMIIFGGCTGSNSSNCSTGLNDTWVLTNANGLTGPSQWIQLQPQGPLPQGRYSHTAVYDANTNRMILFGGAVGGSVFNDVWVLTNANGINGASQWIQLNPSPNIPPRYNHTATYDSVSGSMTVFSGVAGGQETNEVWVLSNANGLTGAAAWTQLSSAGGPPLSRENADAIYDPTSNRMTTFGGLNCAGGCVDLSDVWILTNANGIGSSGLAITQLLPNHGGNAGNATVKIIGSGFVQGDAVSLSSGGTNIPGSGITVAGPGLITATFSLTGVTAGLYDVVVTQVGGGKATLPSGFTVDQGGAANISLQIIGQSTIQIGKTTPFFVAVSNTGNIDSGPSLISIEVPPYLQGAQSSTTDVFVAGATAKPYFGIPGRNSGSDQFMIFATSSTPAGGTQSAPMQLTLPPGQPTNFTVSTGWEFYLSNLNLDDTLNQLGVPFVSYTGSCPQCLNAYTAELLAKEALETQYEVYTDAKLKFQSQLAKTTSQLVGGVAVFAVVTPILDSLGVGTIGGVVIKDLISALQSCANGYLGDPGPQNCLLAQQNLVTLLGNAVQSLLGKGDFPPLAQKALEKLLGALNLIQAGLIDFADLDTAGNAVDSAYQSFTQSLTPYEQARVAYISCLNQPNACGGYQMPPPPPPPPGTGTLPVTGVASSDPNGKFGPMGVGAQGYVAGAPAFGYDVSFENDGNAPAQQVIITDQLDVTRFNLATFALGPLGFGTQFASPASYQTNYARIIDLRPTTNLLVDLSGVLNSKTGLVTWTFTSIDPSTGLPPTDPTIGFLPPGSSGYVLFNVMPKQGLPTNAQVQNQATITFDENPPIKTPTWLNTIDVDAPISKVQPLPPQEQQATFTVSWAGTDIGSGVGTFGIFVSDNGGQFVLWQQFPAAATSADYTGQLNHTYGFYSIARDLTGNIESGKFVAEATTQVTGGDNTPPTITIAANPSQLWPPNGQMVPITISGTMTDSQSGVNASTASFAVTDEYGLVQPNGKVTVGRDGTYSFVVNLQASRNGNDKDGRHYTITVQVRDNANNLGTASTTVIVPHDQGH